MDARVYFAEPSDGAEVGTSMHIKFGLEGMELRPAGDTTPDTGHHCLLIDGRPIPKGSVVPVNSRSIHYSNAQAEADIKLPPGPHTLTLQFADGAHRSYGPEVSQTITVNAT